jgi:hypothetical protein
MHADVPTYQQRKLRGIDSNSLLRMYDQAGAVLDRSPSQMERARADRAVQRIAKELLRRDVTFTARRQEAAGTEGRTASAAPGTETRPR